MLDMNDDEIRGAARASKYANGDRGAISSPDAVRASYVWLDAQKKTDKPTSDISVDTIERWVSRTRNAGNFSPFDLLVAANLHLSIKGSYPRFNISAPVIEPSPGLLEGLFEGSGTSSAV